MSCSEAHLSYNLPLRPKHSLKISAHAGAFTRIGADLDIGTIACQYQWGR